MLDDGSILFWAVAAVLGLLAWEALVTTKPWAKPALAVYAVIGLWYLGDYIQTGPAEFDRLFGRDCVDWAFVQTGLFLVSFRGFVGGIAPLVMPPAGRLRSYDPSAPLGRGEARTFGLLAAAWTLLTVVGLVRLQGDVVSMFLPVLSDEPESPWGRSSVGSGWDFLVSVGEYSHLAVGGMLGVVAVLSRRPWVRAWAWGLFTLLLVPYLFQHARHRALAVLAPPILSYVLIKQTRPAVKVAVAVGLLLLVQSWFIFMTQARTGQRGWADVDTKDLVQQPDGQVSTHIGLEMMRELCHTGVLMDSGRYKPRFMEEYVEQAALLVPRTVWPNKPLAGIEYSIARGFYNPNAANLVFATMCPGLIGQGVANCGTYFGSVAAAFLSALWAALLTRVWGQRYNPERLALFLVGMALTVNMGRGFSPLALFPFAFAYGGVLAAEWVRGGGPGPPAAGGTAGPPAGRRPMARRTA